MNHKHYIKKEKKEKELEKECKVCLKRFKPFKSTGVVCSTKCAIKYAKRKEKDKKQKVRDSVVRYTDLMSEAKRAFQAWVRKRDENEHCISCGTTIANQWHGSHFFKAEIYRGVIFDEDNVHKSCANCNKWLDGNLIPYRANLLYKIGLDGVEALEERADTTRQKKWSRDELVEIRNKYKKLIKEL